MKKVAVVKWENINYYDLFWRGYNNAPAQVRNALESLGSEPTVHQVVQYLMENDALKIRHGVISPLGTLTAFVNEHEDFFQEMKKFIIL